MAASRCGVCQSLSSLGVIPVPRNRSINMALYVWQPIPDHRISNGDFIDPAVERLPGQQTAPSFASGTRRETAPDCPATPSSTTSFPSFVLQLPAPIGIASDRGAHVAWQQAPLSGISSVSRGLQPYGHHGTVLPLPQASAQARKMSSGEYPPLTDLAECRTSATGFSGSELKPGRVAREVRGNIPQ